VALNLQHLGKLIKDRREMLGLSQQDVAYATHLHRTYISDIERGQRNITIGSLQRVAIALDIQLSTLARLAEVSADKESE
jgi:transcriptional regulator with XRE-family HTH domain